MINSKNSFQIFDDCEYDDLDKCLEYLTNNNYEIVELLDGLDSKYIDFKIDEIMFTLHYNVYMGMSINLTSAENQKGREFIEQLITKMKSEVTFSNNAK